MRAISIMAACVILVSSCSGNGNYHTDSIGVEVMAEENREYSYTDKQAGYWYGMTHQEETREWYSG